MTDPLLAHFRQAGFEALLYYTVRSKNAGIFRGRHLFHGATTTISPLPSSGAEAAFVGEVSGIAALQFPEWADKHLYEPGGEVAQITSWDAQIDAIAVQTGSRDVTLIAGAAHGVTLLSQALRKKFATRRNPDAHLQDRWPNLECIAHTGAPISPYAAELRRALGPTVKLHDIYAASEGVIAAQDDEGAQGLRVMADTGLFFEFVPLSDFDDLRLEHLGPKAVPLAGVKPRIDYVILVTTPGGLARYILEDVVRFTSVAPPRLIYVGGTQLRLNALNENVSEKEVSEALVSLCQRRDWTLVNFHVAPLITSGNLTGQQRGSHEWWIELKPGTVVTPTGPQMAVELDAELQRTNATYAAKRTKGVLDSPTVRLVMPGVFEHWLRFHQKWGGPHKMPRCRSDRKVADELAHVTNFAPD